jgi:uncharacterized membrane protein
MAKKVAAKPASISSAGPSDDKVFAFLGVFLTVIGFIIVLLAKKDSKYAMYYAKQGLVLFIAWMIAWVIGFVTMFILIGFIVMPILYIIVFILWIIGIVYSLSGEMKPIPIIGKYADKINL